MFSGDISTLSQDSDVAEDEKASTEVPVYLLLVSGLRVGGDAEDSDISVQLLSDFINGELGGDREAYLASRIAKYA